MQNLSRRSAIGLLGTAPLILGAEKKSGNTKPILGEGSHKYEVTHDWGELPSSIRYGNTHGVCEDSQGHIYVHHTVNKISESHDTMVVFDANGFARGNAGCLTFKVETGRRSSVVLSMSGRPKVCDPDKSGDCGSSNCNEG